MQKKVNISPETMKSMAKFFMKTSVPKMVEEARKKKEEQNREQSEI